VIRRCEAVREGGIASTGTGSSSSRVSSFESHINSSMRSRTSTCVSSGTNGEVVMGFRLSSCCDGSLPNFRFHQWVVRPAVVWAQQRCILTMLVLCTFSAASLFRIFVWVMPKSLKDHLQPPELVIILRMRIASLMRQLRLTDVLSSSRCQTKTRSMSSSY